jgi:hypothetical protein
MMARKKAFHVMAKPTGAVCNLDCEYCFFLSKEMCVLLRANQAPAELMGSYARRDARRGRNDPCPCGNGRKWKQRHGARSAG